jgi:hypothetical protein
VILTKKKRKKKKRIAQHWYLPLLGGPLIFEKFFTHRARNNFEAFHGIEGPASTFSWAQEFRRSLKAIH